MMRTTGMKKYLLTGGLSVILAASLVLPASAATNHRDSNHKSNDKRAAACYPVSWSKDAKQSTNGVGWKGDKQYIKKASLKIQSKGEGNGKWQGWNSGKFEKGESKDSSSTTNTTNQNQSGTTAADKAQFASEVIKLVNQERTKEGLKSLTADSALNSMALVKAKDMNDNNYFSHTSPTYGSPFEMMKSFEITYRYAGENIAKGQKTPAEVVKAWMNSEGHRANILSANYTLIGVGYYNGYWVQEFVGR